MADPHTEETLAKVSLGLAAASPLYFAVLFIGVLPVGRDRLGTTLDSDTAGTLYQLLGTHIEFGVLLFMAALTALLAGPRDARRARVVHTIVFVESVVVFLAAVWALLALADAGPLTVGATLVAATAAGTVPQVALVAGALWLCLTHRRQLIAGGP